MTPFLFFLRGGIFSMASYNKNIDSGLTTQVQGILQGLGADLGAGGHPHGQRCRRPLRGSDLQPFLYR